MSEPSIDTTLQSESSTPLNESELPPCNGANVGVVVVHGIGDQKRGETLEYYGGAIARVWSEFGAADGRTWCRCNEGHLHLLDKEKKDIGLISEAYWADVITHKPSSLQVLGWVIVSAPWLILYSLARFPRPGGGEIIWLLSWFPWFLRVLLAPVLLIAFQLLMAIVLLLRIPFQRRGIALLDGPIETIIGDSYLFVLSDSMREESAQRVARAAASIAPRVDRMIIMAHSQGAAVTAEAVNNDAWPTDELAHLVSVGSGFLRLRTLRQIAQGGVGVFAGVFVTVMAVFDTYLAFLFPRDGDAFGPREIILFTALGLFWITVITLFTRARRAAVSDADRLVESTVISTWTDMWSSHDLVPDGPIKASNADVRRVENARSLVTDHTTYHRNPLQVIVPIVSIIDSERFDADAEVLERLGRRRSRRLFLRRLVDVALVVSFMFLWSAADRQEFFVTFGIFAGSLAAAGLWSRWHRRRTEFEFVGDDRWFALRPERRSHAGGP